MNSRAFLTLVLIALIPTLAACSARVHKPQLAHPGPAAFQQNNATQFDPYPQNDMGPEIVGGRPPDYMKPPDEIVRARQYQPAGPWRSSVSPAPSGPLY